MNPSDDQKPDPAILRSLAEEKLDRRPGIEPLPADNLLHELRVHQIELEMQKEALRKGPETRRQKAKLKRDQQQTGGSVVAQRLWARGRAAEPRNGLNFVR